MFSIITEPLSNIPWEDRPTGNDDLLWRYSANPIIDRSAVKKANSIFNSAAIPFEGKFAGVFRVDSTARTYNIHVGFSDDGINWDLDQTPFNIKSSSEEVIYKKGYDPRVCKIDDEYIVTWCNVSDGYPTIGVAKTLDFKNFEQLENAFLPYNRNGVFFPRKINGNYMMLSRPCGNGHTNYGDIFLSQSPDMTFWGKHRPVLKRSLNWQDTKIGAGPVPIETSEGWLMIYHGVQGSCNGFIYSCGAALLDLEQPWKVIASSERYLLSPRESYELLGDVPNVVFPCAALVDSETGRMAIYYGCADCCTGIAFAYVHEIVEALKNKTI